MEPSATAFTINHVVVTFWLLASVDLNDPKLVIHFICEQLVRSYCGYKDLGAKIQQLLTPCHSCISRNNINYIPCIVQPVVVVAHVQFEFQNVKLHLGPTTPRII